MGPHHNTKVSSAVLSSLQWKAADIARLILIELPGRNRWPAAEFPDAESPLPSDLTPSNGLPSKACATEPFETSRLSAIHTSHVSCFGRQAQAVHLFDQVLTIIDLPTEGEAKVLEFRKMDRETQTFLSLIMDESGYGRWKVRSGVMATTMRYSSYSSVQSMETS